MGGAHIDAYQRAYGKVSRRTASTKASALVAKGDIALKISALRKEHFAQISAEGFLTLEETRRGLADIWRCRLGDLIMRDGMLDIEKVRALPAWVLNKFRVVQTVRVSAKGRVKTTRTTAEIELTDKLRAVALDAELRGDAPAIDPSMPSAERVARRKQAMALLAKMPGHGGHLLEAVEVAP